MPHTQPMPSRVPPPGHRVTAPAPSTLTSQFRAGAVVRPVTTRRPQ